VLLRSGSLEVELPWALEQLVLSQAAQLEEEGPEPVRRPGSPCAPLPQGLTD
jgi:hypothetical protein